MPDVLYTVKTSRRWAPGLFILVRLRQAAGAAGLRLKSLVTHLQGTPAGQTTRLGRYFLTSLGAYIPAHQLLRLIRERWHIEN